MSDKTVIGFSLKVPAEDAEFVDDCVVDMLDDLDVDLDGNLDWLYWSVKPYLIKGAIFASLSAKSTMKSFSQRDDIATVATLSVTKLLSSAGTMKSIRSSSASQIKDSKSAIAAIERWQNSNSSGISSQRRSEHVVDGLADLNLRKKKEGESLTSYFGDIISEIKKHDWTEE